MTCEDKQCEGNAKDNCGEAVETPEGQIVYKELSYRVKEAALAVHRYFGPGFLEKVYENALFGKLIRMGVVCRQQVPLKVYFEDDGQKVVVGEYVADILIEDEIVAEVKAVPAIAKAHFVQLRNYLRTTERRLGFLINFGTPRLGFERVLNSRKRGP